jgi:hypothetical protein
MIVAKCDQHGCAGVGDTCPDLLFKAGSSLFDQERIWKRNVITVVYMAFLPDIKHPS